jgi:CubicO group peptidase (beta-lactamase class C family)
MPGWVLLALLAPLVWVGVIWATATLYQDAAAVPSEGFVAPGEKWAGAAAEARQLVRERVASRNLPGVSVAVGVDGEVRWAEGFGYADLRTGTPVTPEDRFRIGTLSAELTRAAVEALAREGRLRLDDPAGRLQALMARPAREEETLLRRHCAGPGEAAQLLGADGGWVAVAAAAEEAAGVPFDALLRERVLLPRGMRATGTDGARVGEGEDFPLVNLLREVVYDPETRRRAGAARLTGAERVSSYAPRLWSDPMFGVHAMRPVDLSCAAGASGLRATAADLARFGMGAGAVRIDGTLLGGRVATLLGFPEYGMAVAVVANVTHADTWGIAVEVGTRFAAGR